jgi:hypothetical protein
VGVLITFSDSSSLIWNETVWLKKCFKYDPLKWNLKSSKYDSLCRTKATSSIFFFFTSKFYTVFLISYPIGMDAWNDLFVPKEVLWALKSQGFREPTPIQSQILPSAIRDKMDIVGAAETVSGILFLVL